MVSSLIYKFSERIAVKGIGLVIQIILARLLAPSVFGQLAILMVFINLSQSFVQSGLNTALVQNKDVTIKDYSTVFYISLAIGIVFNALVFFSAPIIADYYDETAIVLPLRVFSFTILIAAFNSVQTAKMQKEMLFKETMWCNLISTVISGAVGILMAYNDFGLWALVAYNMLQITITCITMSFAVKWFPMLTFSIKRAKILFSFGWKMLVSGLLCSFYNDVRTLIIGKKYSTEDLAYYNRGDQFPNMISTTIDDAIQSVMFPAFASVQDDKEKIKHTLKKTMMLGLFVISPFLMLLFGISENFIRVILTDKWLPALAFMQIMCVAKLCCSLQSTNLVVIKAIGRSDAYMKLEVIRRIAMMIILLVSVFCFDSLMAIAIGYAISSWVDAIIILIPMKKFANYGIFEQLCDSWKIYFSGIIMAAVVVFIGELSLLPIIEMVLQVTVGVITYLLISYIIKVDCFMDVIEKIKNKRMNNTH